MCQTARLVGQQCRISVRHAGRRRAAVGATTGYPVELHDIWAFTDFWRRRGIRYPDPADPVAAGVELAPGWVDRLPGSGEWSP